MKKLCAAILVLTLVLSMFTGVASANDQRVEIEFYVGDETLMINGQPVTVAKPYVVGEGVTLVPVRVITEAFGAEVDWVEETQTVTLKYPDVNIVLQIGNPVAEVNGKSETLLAAPELPGDYTMVPLRFISENFGAEVSYDEATEKITVVKELSTGDSSLVEGGIEETYIGDSYYGWMMENPKDMQMSKREFDGTETRFEYGEKNVISISVYNISEDYNFEKSYSGWKDEFKNYTLVKAEKNTSDKNRKYMHIQAKDKTMFCEVYEYITADRAFVLLGIYDNTNAQDREKGIKLLETFDTTFTGNDIYDLSNVKDGYRKFEAETLKLKIDIPAHFALYSDKLENAFEFVSYTKDDNESEIKVEVYSKDNVYSAQSLATKDYEYNKSNYNEAVVTFDKQVSQNSYTNIRTYEYSYTIKTKELNTYIRDIFFELGEYVYNVVVKVKLPHENKEKFVRTIMNSVEISEINFAEVGTLIRNDDETEGTFEMKGMSGCTIVMPNSYEELANSTKNDVMYTNGLVVFYGMVYDDADYVYTHLKSALREYERAVGEQGGTIISGTADTTIGNKKFATMTYVKETNGIVAYGEVYFTTHEGKAYAIEVIYPQLLYSQAAREEVRGMIESITFE